MGLELDNDLIEKIMNNCDKVEKALNFIENKCSALGFVKIGPPHDYRWQKIIDNGMIMEIDIDLFFEEASYLMYTKKDGQSTEHIIGRYKLRDFIHD